MAGATPMTLGVILSLGEPIAHAATPAPAPPAPEKE
jgi:hypothetical protein